MWSKRFLDGHEHGHLTPMCIPITYFEGQYKTGLRDGVIRVWRILPSTIPTVTSYQYVVPFTEKLFKSAQCRLDSKCFLSLTPLPCLTC